MPFKLNPAIFAREAAARVEGKERKQWRKNRGSYVAQLKKENKFRIEVQKEFPTLIAASKAAVERFPFIHNHTSRRQHDLEHSRRADLFVAQRVLFRVVRYAPKKEQTVLKTLFQSIIADHDAVVESRLVQQDAKLLGPRKPLIASVQPSTYLGIQQRLTKWCNIIEESNLVPHMHQPVGHSLYHGLVEARSLVHALVAMQKKS